MCKGLRWTQSGMGCPCSTPLADCDECREVLRLNTPLGSANPCNFIILQDRLSYLHVHRRVPLAAVLRDGFRIAIVYGYKRQGHYTAEAQPFVATVYINLHASQEWEIVEGNLRAIEWRILMPFRDGSSLYETPGQILGWQHDSSADRVMLALLAENEVSDLKQAQEDLLRVLATFYVALGSLFFGLIRGKRLTEAVTKALLGLDWLFGERVWKIEEILTTKPREHLRIFAEWLKMMRGSEEWQRVLSVGKGFNLLDETGRPKVEK